ncbi:DNA-directed RNA polymerase II subunit 1 [Camellia lanceoleosa]|uniref:DNA-directed RNA polymerase II subunit 1 n=1 Tax=Camellia lanceoleosa TaxID=1840588 RepID=A0ACC0GXU2_9ERIC|nr:DNA-directed RNA polymerase II subunit 1 [Camellia lanceoleosa]
MDGSTTIKPEMLMSGSEEASAADSKKSMSAAKLAELALIDPKPTPPPINPPPKTAPPPPSNPPPKTSPHPPTTEPKAPAPSVDCTTLIYGMSDCLTYLTVGNNETNPKDTCCTGLKTVLDTDADCLCEGLKSSASLGFNIDFKKAKAIPSVCKIPTPPSLTSSPSPPGAPSPPGHTNEIDTQGQDTDEPVKKSRGGCGAQQPTLTIEGMKMIAEYKLQKKKNDDPEQLPEPVERKQQLSAERVASMKKCF